MISEQWGVLWTWKEVRMGLVTWSLWLHFYSHLGRVLKERNGRILDVWIFFQEVLLGRVVESRMPRRMRNIFKYQSFDFGSTDFIFSSLWIMFFLFFECLLIPDWMLDIKNVHCWIIKLYACNKYYTAVTSCSFKKKKKGLRHCRDFGCR